MTIEQRVNAANAQAVEILTKAHTPDGQMFKKPWM